MPLERHWQQVNTPLRALTGREKRILLAALAVVLAAIVAVVIAAAGSSDPPLRPGCIAAFEPGATGGVLVQGCGARARRICADRRHASDPGSVAIEASCRRAGI